MRRNVVLSVLCLFIYLLVSCSLVESSEEKGVFALGLNFAMPQNAVAESRGLSRDGEEVNHDEDYQGNEEDWNSIEYTAVVNVIWDGGGSVSTGTLKKVPGQKTAKGDIVVLGVPYEKSLTVNLQIKDSDGDVLYSGTTTTSLKNSTPIEINLSYSEDLDLDLDLKIKYKAILSSDIKLVATYNNTEISEEPISLLDKSEGAEITFTCLDSEGNPIPDDEVSSYSWYLNGESISGTTSSISIDPYAQKLLDLGEKNYVECVVTYSNGEGKKLACVKGFSFAFIDDIDLSYVIYPVGGISTTLHQYNETFKLDEEIVNSVMKFAVNPSTNDIYAITEAEAKSLIRIKYSLSGSYEKDTEHYLDLSDFNGIFAMTVGLDGKIWVAMGEYDIDNGTWTYFVCAYSYDQNSGFTKIYELTCPSSIKSGSISTMAAQNINSDDYLVMTFVKEGSVDSTPVVQAFKVVQDSDGLKKLESIGAPVSSKTIVEGCHTFNDMAFVRVENSAKLCVLMNGSVLSEGSNPVYCRGAVVLGEINTGAAGETDDPSIKFDKVDGKTAAFGLIGSGTPFKKWSINSLEDIDACYPYGKQESSCFFDATKIVAIKEDVIYIADDGIYQKEDSDVRAGTNKDRIMEFNLQDKTVSVYADGLYMSVPSSGLFSPNSGYTIENY